MISYFLEYFFSGISALLLLLLLGLVFGGRLSGKARFCLVLYVLYISAMFNVVGLPGIPYVNWDPTLNLIPFSEIGEPRYLWLSVMNTLMLVPLGFLLPQIWGRFRSFWDTALAGLATSLFIELLQLFSFRATDVDDLIFNTFHRAPLAHHRPERKKGSSRLPEHPWDGVLLPFLPEICRRDAGLQPYEMINPAASISGRGRILSYPLCNLLSHPDAAHLGAA